MSARQAAWLCLSDERDQWERRLAAEYRAGFDAGRETGVAIGRQQVLDEEAAWRRGTARLTHDGPSHADVDARRWGPGGRECFADARPGDFRGRAT